MPNPIEFQPLLTFLIDGDPSQDKSKPFSLDHESGWIDVAQFPGGDGGGVAVYVGGFKVTQGPVPVPTRIDWELYAGSPCMMDNEPCAETSTWLPLVNASTERSGLLFQVTGRRAGRWQLRARVPLGSSQYIIGGSITYEHILSAGACAEPIVSIGPVAG